MTSLVQTARHEAQQLLTTAPATLSTPLVRAALTVHRTLSAPTQTPSLSLDLLRRQSRRCGRRSPLQA